MLLHFGSLQGAAFLAFTLLYVTHSSAADTPQATTAVHPVLYTQTSKACAPGCEKFGNCNPEEGRCECPWGRTGAACEIEQLGACTTGYPEDPGSCGLYIPKNCHCYKACLKLYCHHGQDWARCEHEIGQLMPGEMTCYVYKDKPISEQRSILSTDPLEVQWYKSFQEINNRPDAESAIPPEEWGLTNTRDNLALPPSNCQNSCSGHGSCAKYMKDAGAGARCLCKKGWNGTDCSTPDPHEACWFAPDCNGHGVCKAGFCHCQPGWFGVGCARSKAFEPANIALPPPLAMGATSGVSRWAGFDASTLPPPSRAKLKIYLYEVPWQVSFPYEFNDAAFGRDPMYTAYEYFMQYFLQDDAVRTENPFEANIFYIPALVYFYIGNVRNPVPHLEHVIQYIKEEYPFWNRTGGKDHIFWVTGDRGQCHLPRELQETGIKLTHFGMHMKNLEWADIHNKDYACVDLRRDVITPPINMFLDTMPSNTTNLYNELKANGGRDPGRDLLFFFAGGVNLPDIKYSGGARQALYYFLKNNTFPDVKFVEGRTEQYRKLFLTSKFCIAPYGHGWGLRVVIAMEFGCIPVIIQDHVYQPFEDFLPYEEFSVRVSVKDVPRIVDILRAFSDEDQAKMRLSMATFYRAFIWPRQHDGRAYELTLKALHRRMFNYWGEYFRRRRQQR